MRLVIDLQGAQGSNAKRGIGRYSRELALAMVRAPRQHDVVVALNGTMLETAEDLSARFSALLPPSHLRSWFSAPSSAGPYAAQAARVVRAQFLASLQPDIVHVSSIFEGLGDGAVTFSPPGLERLPLVGTCYDLIPLIRHKEYLEGQGVLAPHRRWYYAGLHEMFLAEGLLAISESSRQEAITHLGFDAGKVSNIQAGIGPAFRPPETDEAAAAARLAHYGVQTPYILFVGAGDPRKNEQGFIEAYARLPAELRALHQLVLVGHVDEERLRQLLADAGTSPEKLRIVPFVQEDDLPVLYGNCAVFVFPSLHEGFGLPAAEAMACGAPVIASNTSSLPEVVGLDEALFDPARPAEIAERMARVLQEPEWRQRLSAHGLQQARRFTWDACAERAWDALEQIQDRRVRQGHGRVTALQPLPSMAFVSPLPPQESGIADYSRSLLPALSRHYDITLVSEPGQTDDPWLEAAFPQLDAQRFLQRNQGFDRVLYQAGCSDFHTFQYRDLLPVHPGVTVLHDAFLSNLWNWLAHHQGRPGDFLAHLYHSHGYPALHYEARHGRDEAVRQYPCCLNVLDQSLSLIQHSEYGRTILAMHFGAGVRDRIRIIPHLAHARVRPEREAARKALGIGPGEFLVCSFGIVSPAKMPGRVLEAWSSVAGGNGRLVFVGAVAGEPEGFALRNGEREGDVTVTGRVGQEEYDQWLAAADMAIQLRRDSRGETSGAITDCLCFGVPLIVNRHGTATELPDDCVWKLPEQCTTEALGEAIGLLRDDAERRHALARAGKAYTEQRLRPARIAQEYHAAIEASYAKQQLPSLAGASLGLARLRAAPWPGEEELSAVSQSLEASFRPAAPRRRLLVDMSEMARFDARSGIQRVVREVSNRLLASSGNYGRVEAVRFDGGGLRHAHEAATRVLGTPPLPLAETLLDMGEGDTLLCIDLNPKMTEAEFTDLRRRKLAGLQLVLVVYDLLPMLRPDCFPAGIVEVSAWYARMLSMADHAICISRAVADELCDWLDTAEMVRDRPLPVDYFHLAGDFKGESATGEPPGSVLAAMSCTARRPTFLMTGTLEPRKGYRQAVAAFEQLWAEGVDVGLLIVGKEGWQMSDLAEHLRTHPYLGGRLHWLEGVRDVDLRRLYGMSHCLLMASEGEGFGLPLVEAAQTSLPILARDLPVFQEVAGENAMYFSGLRPEDLAAALGRWLEAREKDEVPSSARIRTQDWDGTVRQLLDRLDAKQPYRLWAKDAAPAGPA